MWIPGGGNSRPWREYSQGQDVGTRSGFRPWGLEVREAGHAEGTRACTGLQGVCLALKTSKVLLLVSGGNWCNKVPPTTGKLKVSESGSEDRPIKLLQIATAIALVTLD